MILVSALATPFPSIAIDISPTIAIAHIAIAIHISHTIAIAHIASMLRTMSHRVIVEEYLGLQGRLLSTCWKSHV